MNGYGPILFFFVAPLWVVYIIGVLTLIKVILDKW